MQTYQAKDVINLIIKDFESFFNNNYKVKLDYGNHNGLAIKGRGKKARILIPKDFSEMIIKSDEDLIYVLILLGHELAHHINKHNSYIANVKQENKAIEMWADYFGISISLTIFLYDTNFHKLLFNKYNSNDEYMSIILKVYDKLYTKVYKNYSGDYENAEYRLTTVYTGIISWIAKVEITRNYFSDYPKDPAIIYRDYSFHWGMRLLKLLDTNSMLYNVLRYMHPIDDLEKVKENSQLVLKIHQEIKGNNIQITDGVKSEFMFILGTNYVKNPNVRKLEELLDELK